MKIFFSLNHFLPDRIAGIEVYTFNLARHLQLTGIEVAVLVPNFDATENDTYLYEGIRVIRYAENSASNREMIMGKQAPTGLMAYQKVIATERPSIVHFQEIASGRGIGMFHVQAVAAMGIKIVLTCHLSTYSCQTGNLVYKDERLCDGLIRASDCTACAFHARGINGMKSIVLQETAKLLHAVGLDTSGWNSSIATALGFPFLVEKKKQELIQLARLCDKIIVLTRWYQRILEINGVPANKIQYCPQGVTGVSMPVAPRLASLPIQVVFIGRVSKYKGVHLLLEAVKALPAEKIQVAIYGPVTEDDYGKSCRELSKDMSNVAWKGSIASNQVIPMLAQYDLLCLPSTFSEMSPLVIQEAFAAGIPILASNVYGNAEQITNEINGWLFTFKNSADIARKLAMLIENPGLIDEAKKHLPEVRGFSTVADQHIALYTKVLTEARNQISVN